MRKIHVALLIVITLLVVQTSAQQQKDYKKLNKYIQEAVESYQMPGLAIGIIKNNEVVFVEGYGYRNTESKQEVDENTLFGIASCSKAFTAACLAILVDEGKIAWNDRVIDHYPQLQLSNPYITRELMVKDLLCHRAGYQTFDGDLLWYGTNYSREEVIRRFRYRENPYSLREKFGYSNLMYILAGEVVKQVSGKTWDEFVTKKIFIPLDMSSSTTTNIGFENKENIAWPHLDGQPMSFINYDNSGPAVSINTSVSELLKWVQLMLNKGAWNDTSIFSEKEYNSLVKPQTMLNAGSVNTIDGTHFSTYGLGWFMKDYHGRKVIQHGGGLPGFHSKVVFIPEDSLGYIILANELSLLVEALDKDLLDFHLVDSVGHATRYLPYKKMQKERKAKKRTEMEEQREKDTKPSLSLEKYTGKYEDKMYGLAEISMKNDKLYLEMIPTKEQGIEILDEYDVHYGALAIQYL